jgi:hypothetical protein
MELTPDSVGFGYRYEVLAFRENKKYANREAKKNGESCFDKS